MVRHPRLRLSPTVAAIAATVVAVMPVFLTGAMAVQLRDSLHFGPTMLGIVVGADYAASAVSATLIGRLADRRGSTWPVRAGLVLNAGALIGIGTVVGSWEALGLALACAGAGNGAIQTGTNRLIARTVRAGRQGWSYGVKQAAIPTATLTGGLAVPVVALTVGWRWAFVACGLAALTLPWLLPAEVAERTAGAPERTTPRLAPLLPVMISAALGAASANALGAFLAVSAVDSGVAPANAGLLIAIGAITSLVARLIAGWQADRSARDGFVIVATMMGVGAFGYAMLASGWLSLIVPGTLLAFGAGWGWAGLLNYSVVQAHPRSPASATGLTQGGAYVGGIVGPVAFGLISTHLSMAAAWGTAGAAVIVASATMLIGRAYMRRVPA